MSRVLMALRAPGTDQSAGAEASGENGNVSPSARHGSGGRRQGGIVSPSMLASFPIEEPRTRDDDDE